VFLFICLVSSVTFDASNSYTEIQAKQALFSSQVQADDVTKSKDEILKELSYYKNFIYNIKWFLTVACLIGASLFFSSDKIAKLIKARQSSELVVVSKEIPEKESSVEVYDILKNTNLIEQPPHYNVAI